MTKSLYYRGMDGDALNVSGQTTWNQRRVTITDSQGSGIVDADGMQGQLLEQTQMDGAQVNSSDIHTYTRTQTADRSTPASGGQDWFAYMVTDTKDQTRSWLPLSSTWRWSETDSTYNTYGLPTLVKDLGDTSTSSDDTCTTTNYATADTTKWLIDFPSQEIQTDCATTPGDSDYLGSTHYDYDGLANGVTPTHGLVTQTNVLASVVSGVQTFKKESSNTYDSYGRAITAQDALGNETDTQYVPATGGPVTETKEFNPKGWGTYTFIEPGHGSVTSTTDVNGKVTSASYDPLGRLVKVWANNRSTTLTPDLQYSYGLSATVANWIETQRLGPTGAQIASYSVFDGQTRLRQVQEATPVANGGREITDTQYDGRGLKAKVSTFYNSASAPTSTLGTFTDSTVPQQEQFTYDNLERETVDAAYTMGAFEYQTSSVYQGDREAEIPPTGGVIEQKMFDTSGNITELRQFTSTDLNGTFKATDYTYDRLNQLTKLVDPSGNTWTWTFDLRSRTTASTDPDSGTTTSTYDDNDNQVSTTDARGKTLYDVYDNLNRKTDEYDTNTSGTHLSNWTYDTLDKGQLTSSTNYFASAAYTTAVTGYHDAYRPLGTSLTVPAAQGSAISGTWTTSKTYNVDGSVATTTYPAAGGLGAETVTNTYDTHGYQLTSGGLDTYMSDATYQPWGDVYQRTLGTGSNRVQVTTDEWADTHKDKTITVRTEHPGTPGTFDEAMTQGYSWNGDGELTSIDDQHAGSTTGSQCFSYDYLQRLTTAFTTTPALGGCAAAPSTSTVGGPDAYWQTYTYDDSGNRTSLDSHGLAGTGDTSSTYTYPTPGTVKAHTLTGVSTTGPGGTTTNSYTYGGIGQTQNRTINGLSTDYIYNTQGTLKTSTIHATGGDQTTTYYYDADGNQILRATPTSKTLYLGSTDINTTADGNTITGVTRYYTCGDTTIASRNNPGTLSWIANDDQNTADVSVDQSTLTVSIRKQDPFGNARGTVPNWPNPRGFVGGVSEPDGLVHLGDRMYDASTGRFTSDDSVTETGNPQQLNGYAYAYNNPTTYSDPTGDWGFHIHIHLSSIVKVVANVASIASIIPGPIGSACAGVAAVAYFASGDKADGAMMVAQIALSMAGAGAVGLAAKVAMRGAKIVRAARDTEIAVRDGMKAKVGLEAAKRIARGGRIHAIAKGLTRPLERLGAKVDRAIPGIKGRPDWRFGRHILELKRGSAAGTKAGAKALRRYGRGMAKNGVHNSTGWLLQYPAEPSWNPFRWRLSRIF